MVKRTLLIVIVVSVIAAACGDASIGDTTEAPGAAVPVPSTTTSSPGDFDPAPVDDDDVGDVSREPDPDDPMDGSLLDRALADLAVQLGKQVSEIRIVHSEEVTWRDGSLGCPEPGMGYTQALVSGWRALLEADGEQYSYHAAINGDPFLCEDPREPIPGDPGDA